MPRHRQGDSERDVPIVPPAERPLRSTWMTDELIADTRRVWSKAYGRIITDEECIEILANIKRLAEVLNA